MKQPIRKAFAVLTAGVILLAGVLAACSKPSQPTEAVVSAVPTEKVTIEAPEKELISFTVTDGEGNVLTLIPVYNTDANTVIAGYVSSVKDKNGKALKEGEHPALGHLIGITQQGNKLTPDTAENGALLLIEAYADEKGTLLAMQDVKDLNQNADNLEFLKLNFAEDANGISRYMVEYTAVPVVKKQDGTASATVDGKRQTVQAVDETNTRVREKAESDRKKNEQVQKEKGTSKKETTTKKKKEKKKTDDKQDAENKDSEDKKDTPAEEPEEDTTAQEEPRLGIVLLPNRTAKTDAGGVDIATGSVTITQPGDYEITSDTDVWHGQIIVRLPNTEKAEIAFRNVNIQNDTTNIIQIIDTSIDENRGFLEAETGLDEYASDYVEALSEYDMAPNVQLSFPEGTHSSFTTTVNSHTGVLYNESKLIIKGHGRAEFGSVRNCNNAICSTKSIKIRNLHLTLSTPQNTNTSVLDKATGSAKGIFSYSRVTVESGTVDIQTNGDGIRCQKFEILDGTANIRSSACDGIDADDMIKIEGGSIRVTASEKSSFKVRRINNTEKGYVKGRVRPDKEDTFAINGGSVYAESKRVSTVQPESKQPSLSCRIVKPSAGTQAAALEVKTPAVISIDGVKSSSVKCTKFLYSAPSLTAGKLYEASAGGNSTKMTEKDWNKKVGTIRIISSNR